MLSPDRAQVPQNILDKHKRSLPIREVDAPIELRLTLIEAGFPDRVAAYRFSREEMMDLVAPLKDGPFAHVEEIEAIRYRRALNDKIEAVGRLLGKNLADFRDDRDGHNGERRVQIIAKSTYTKGATSV